jgi:hypothetical protein
MHQISQGGGYKHYKMRNRLLLDQAALTGNLAISTIATLFCSPRRLVMHLSQVLPQLFVGSCPTNTDDINHLKADYGITAILNLQTDHDFDYCELDWGRIESRCNELGIAVQRIPVS